MDSTLPAVHPGEILREEYLVPLDIYPGQLASTLKVPFEVIDRLVNENGPVTAELALKLAKYFRTSAEFWMHAQTSYDLHMAFGELRDQLETISELENLSEVANAMGNSSQPRPDRLTP
ncbi:HigA family addiction module antitoxin [uncultured Martelella sp.]|uniref:HigA family addiction module antitoxin n=1 Tax=uncultured Martelella sp. TaxID=392331 RepID=UPI0029C62AC2|nr:HigA family addiction module antitoxin [uncultured Martelella sp.]